MTHNVLWSRAATVLASAALFAAAAPSTAKPDPSSAPLRLDRGFGSRGLLRSIAVGGERLDIVNAIAIDGLGRIVVAGLHVLPERGGPGTPRPDRTAVARLLPDGRRDLAFGGDGLVVLPESGFVRGLAVDAQRRVILCGSFGTAAGTGTAAESVHLLRLREDGSPDPEFAGDGTTALPSRWASPRSVRTDPTSGALYLAAVDASDAALRDGVVRVTAQGEFDPSFGDLGFAAAGSSVHDVAVDGLGRVLSAADEGVRRFTTAGAPDTSAGTDGFLHGPHRGAILGRAVRISDSGRILVLGTEQGSDTTQIFRFLPSGAVDPVFGEGGFATPPLGLPRGFAGSLAAIAPIPGPGERIQLLRTMGSDGSRPRLPRAAGAAVQAFDHFDVENVRTLSQRFGRRRDGAGVSPDGLAVTADGTAAIVALTVRTSASRSPSGGFAPVLFRIDLTK